MIDLISSSRVVVCPYKDATQSGVAITALSFNKPVVASKVGGFTDLIINGINGFLVEPDDVLELKQAMELFLKDPFLCHTLSSQIQSSLKKNGFDWNQIVKKIFWVYDEITP
jgi:glycosyltransferase involved in cell wall biosynthesis